MKDLRVLMLSIVCLPAWPVSFGLPSVPRDGSRLKEQKYVHSFNHN